MVSTKKAIIPMLIILFAWLSTGSDWITATGSILIPGANVEQAKLSRQR
jgi:hypothetical protein